MRRAFRQALSRASGWVFLVLLGLEGALGAYLVVVPQDGLAMRRLYTSVANVTDPAAFGARNPAGPPPALGEEDVAFLRAWTEPVLAGKPDEYARVVALREHVHRAVPIGPEPNAPANPVPALRKALRRGERPPEALCGTFARLLVAAARVHGYDARLLHLRPRTARPAGPWLDPNTGHYTAELFLPSLGRWVVMDPLYNAHFLVDRLPAGALDLHRALERPHASGHVAVMQGPTQGGRMDATTLLPYFAHLAVVGDAAFRSGPEMLLRGERLRMVNWLDPTDPPLRRWDGLALAAFLGLGVALVGAGGLAIARIRWDWRVAGANHRLRAAPSREEP
jgi:hypothetical protein